MMVFTFWASAMRHAACPARPRGHCKPHSRASSCARPFRRCGNPLRASTPTRHEYDAPSTSQQACHKPCQLSSKGNVRRRTSFDTTWFCPLAASDTDGCSKGSSCAFSRRRRSSRVCLIVAFYRTHQHQTGAKHNKHNGHGVRDMVVISS